LSINYYVNKSLPNIEKLELGKGLGYFGRIAASRNLTSLAVAQERFSLLRSAFARFKSFSDSS
jgi:hypothetical protein